MTEGLNSPIKRYALKPTASYNNGAGNRPPPRKDTGRDRDTRSTPADTNNSGENPQGETRQRQGPPHPCKYCPGGYDKSKGPVDGKLANGMAKLDVYYPRRKECHVILTPPAVGQETTPPQQIILQQIEEPAHQMIRIPVLLNNRRCVALVDTAVSHNFIRGEFWYTSPPIIIQGKPLDRQLSLSRVETWRPPPQPPQP
ncbi:hypothetical protein PR048_001217 [Dryococelus australis]|uniref:Uncharacterized protein n=1 Tax=Dryococelus australis TaxID=614101 RepID=A0ABQ9IGS3_9NEOP|nr:hypothetical protein PR048_001217 [Dryococelus australis]